MSLIHFNQPLFKELNYGNISFSLLLNPENGSVDKEIFINGSWEKEVLEVMRQYVKEDSVCLDVGANIGHHTLFMASLATRGEVHAFEPLERLCNQIDASVKKNGLSNVFIHRYGLSDTTFSQDIKVNLLNIGKTNLDEREQGGHGEKVVVKHFDDIWNKERPVSFIKMDVEGHEYRALKGMQEMLKRDRPIFLFEYSPIFYTENNTNCREFLKFIFDLQYRIYDLEKDSKEFTSVSMDEFMSGCTFQTNLLCLPKCDKNSV